MDCRLHMAYCRLPIACLLSLLLVTLDLLRFWSLGAMTELLAARGRLETSRADRQPLELHP